eukprot:m.42663 g.42663  ORF g.42663 m.42663 type:complete len:258 (-) comp9897_c0_seq1:798-1571(-)
MGRKKIDIKHIDDDRNRQITFSKRKSGIIKKAFELSQLCGVDVALFMVDNKKKIYEFCSGDMSQMMVQYCHTEPKDIQRENQGSIKAKIEKEEKKRLNTDKSQGPPAALPIQGHQPMEVGENVSSMDPQQLKETVEAYAALQSKGGHPPPPPVGDDGKKDGDANDDEGGQPASHALLWPASVMTHDQHHHIAMQIAHQAAQKENPNVPEGTLLEQVQQMDNSQRHALVGQPETRLDDGEDEGEDNGGTRKRRRTAKK